MDDARPNVATTDHIYPASMLTELTPEQRAQLPRDFADLNRVRVCRRDNQLKGHLHPLDWLVIMPDNHCAAKLAERLIKMGEGMEEVFDSLRRRRK